MMSLKKLTISIALLVAGTTFAFARGQVEGNGVITSQEHRVPAFERVYAQTNAEVRIHFAEESRIVVNADSNLHEYIEIREKDGALEIRTPRREKYFPRFSVDVYCPIVNQVSLAGTASIELVNPVTVQSFAAKMTGSGTITLRGSAENIEIKLVGDGTIDARDFRVGTVTASVVGHGEIFVWADNIDINVVGNATISYRGSPELNITGVGNGRFVRLGD